MDGQSPVEARGEQDRRKGDHREVRPEPAPKVLGERRGDQSAWRAGGGTGGAVALNLYLGQALSLLGCFGLVLLGPVCGLEGE